MYYTTHNIVRTPCFARMPALPHQRSEPIWVEEVEEGQIEEAICSMVCYSIRTIYCGIVVEFS